MRCFEFDLNKGLNINMLNQEQLIPPRLHCARYAPEYIMYIIIQGELHLEENGEEIRLFAGDVHIFKKGEFHKPLESTFCRYYYIHFNQSEISEYDVSEEEYTDIVRKKKIDFFKSDKYTVKCYEYMSVLLKQHWHIENGEFLNYCIDILEKNAFSNGYPDMEKRINISYNVIKLFLKLEGICCKSGDKSKEGAKVYSRVKQIATYLEKNFTSDICGNDNEKEFFINFDYANRIFKKIMGSSIIKYRNRLRIDAAKMSMLVADKTFSEISEETGFRDERYFNRIFKKYEGITPGEYRTQILSGISSE